MKNKVIIGIGSNISAEENIQRALEWLEDCCRLLKVSSFDLTAPIGIIDQPWFTNGAVLVETNLDQQSFNKELKNIEDQMGRDRSVPKFGPRCIDLDIVVWNSEVVDNDVYARNFLKKAIKELWPEVL